MVDTVTFCPARVAAWPAIRWGHVETDRRTGLPVEVGHFDCLRVQRKADGEVVISGSLPRYLLGENVTTMTRAHVADAVTALAGVFGFDPAEARAYRLDLAATMTMPHPVAAYLPLLVSAPRLKRSGYEGESVIFQNLSRTLSFYDKGKESGCPGNLLRFEVQFKKRVRRQLGRVLTLADLYDPETFDYLVGRWQDAYAQVRKQRRHVLTPTSKRGELRRQFAQLGLDSQGGPSAMLPLIASWDVGRSARHGLRQEVNALAADGNSEADAVLIRELDAAVARVAERMRA